MRREVQAELVVRAARALNRAVPSTVIPKSPTPNERNQRLLKRGWLCNKAGRWSRWFDKTPKRAGWACYQLSRALAVVVQDYLDQQRLQARNRKRRVAQ
jgi:hypothetical protein